MNMPRLVVMFFLLPASVYAAYLPFSSEPFSKSEVVELIYGKERSGLNLSAAEFRESLAEVFDDRLGISKFSISPDDLVQHVRASQVMDCVWGRDDVLIRRIDAKSRRINEYARLPRPGEKCLYHPEAGIILSLECLNTIRDFRIKPQPSGEYEGAYTVEPAPRISRMIIIKRPHDGMIIMGDDPYYEGYGYGGYPRKYLFPDRRIIIMPGDEWGPYYRPHRYHYW